MADARMEGEIVGITLDPLAAVMNQPFLRPKRVLRSRRRKHPGPIVAPHRNR